MFILVGHLNAYLIISAVEEEKEPCPLVTESVPSRLSGIRGRFVVAGSVNFKTAKETEAAAGGAGSSAKTIVCGNERVKLCQLYPRSGHLFERATDRWYEESAG
jgi:hypothetical protein